MRLLPIDKTRRPSIHPGRILSGRTSSVSCPPLSFFLSLATAAPLSMRPAPCNNTVTHLALGSTFFMSSSSPLDKIAGLCSSLDLGIVLPLLGFLHSFAKWLTLFLGLWLKGLRLLGFRGWLPLDFRYSCRFLFSAIRQLVFPRSYQLSPCNNVFLVSLPYG